MSINVSSDNHAEWARFGLKDYGDFAECVTDVNVRTYGDDTTSGEWYFIDDDKTYRADGRHERYLAVYSGDWGNYHSPGAYVHADLYEILSPDDMEEFSQRVEELTSQPEYDPDWECEADDDEDQPDDESETTFTQDGDKLTIEIKLMPE